MTDENCQNQIYRDFEYPKVVRDKIAKLIKEKTGLEPEIHVAVLQCPKDTILIHCPVDILEKIDGACFN